MIDHKELKEIIFVNLIKRIGKAIARPFKIIWALIRTVTSRDTRKVTDDPDW